MWLADFRPACPATPGSSSGGCVSRGYISGGRQRHFCAAQATRTADVSSAAGKKQRRLSEVVASLQELDRRIGGLSAALDSNSSSSSSSDEEHSAGATTTATLAAGKQPMRAAAEVSSPPASSTGLRLDRPIDLDAWEEGRVQRLAPSAAPQVGVCTAKSCKKKGSEELLRVAQAAAQGSGVEVAACDCVGKCKLGPNIQLSTGSNKPRVQTGVQIADLPEVLKALDHVPFA